MYRFAALLSLLFVGAYCSGPVQAALIAYDNFESYTAGAAPSGSGGSGWTNNWSVIGKTGVSTTVVNASLSYSAGAVTIGGGTKALQTTFSGFSGDEGITDGLYHRGIPSQSGGVLYMSLLFRDVVNPDLGTSNDFVQWGLDSGTTNPRTSIMRRNAAFQARTGTSNNSSNGGAASVGATFFLVFKAQKTGLIDTTGTNYDRVSLFVNPTTLTEPTASAVASGNTGIASVVNFLARSAFHENGDTFLIDEVRVGTTWAAVVVPEPGALVLAFGGLPAWAAFAAARRRRLRSRR